MANTCVQGLVAAVTAGRAELPASVVDRCHQAASQHLWIRTEVENALAEFLAILEERGLRVVPVEMTEKMDVAAALSLDQWRAAMSVAPPLAELLEDREHG